MTNAGQGRISFVTGSTGLMGSSLLPALLRRGHGVRALVRPGSERKVPNGATAVTGDALKPETYEKQIAPADTFVQLVGVAHPSPAKAREFGEIDLKSARGAIAAARSAGVRHFIYLSVAQPAPIMKEYVAVRAECEALLRKSEMNVTIVRPWYVLGPGRRWPLALLPMYWVAERIPALRDGARRLGLVTLAQMTATLVRAVEDPPAGVRVIEVPEIRAASL